MKSRFLDFQTQKNKVTVNADNIAIIERKIPHDIVTMNITDNNGQYIRFEVLGSISETNEKHFMPDKD